MQKKLLSNIGIKTSEKRHLLEWKLFRKFLLWGLDANKLQIWIAIPEETFNLVINGTFSVFDNKEKKEDLNMVEVVVTPSSCLTTMLTLLQKDLSHVEFKLLVYKGVDVITN